MNFDTWRISFQALNFIITKIFMFQENILNLNIKFMSLFTGLDSQERTNNQCSSYLVNKFPVSIKYLGITEGDIKQ